VGWTNVAQDRGDVRATTGALWHTKAASADNLISAYPLQFNFPRGVSKSSESAPKADFL
jgi:hypothetical protein